MTYYGMILKQGWWHRNKAVCLCTHCISCGSCFSALEDPSLVATLLCVNVVYSRGFAVVDWETIWSGAGEPDFCVLCWGVTAMVIFDWEHWKILVGAFSKLHVTVFCILKVHFWNCLFEVCLGGSPKAVICRALLCLYILMWWFFLCACVLCRMSSHWC